MVEVKFAAQNEVLSISGETNDNSEVAQSTLSLNSGKRRKISTKICDVLRSWHITKDNIGRVTNISFVTNKSRLQHPAQHRCKRFVT